MISVGPTFFSSPDGSPPPGPGPVPVPVPDPVPSNILFGSFNVELAVIDGEKALLVYQGAASEGYGCFASVVTDIGEGRVAFGVPVRVSIGVGALNLHAMYVLDFEAGTYICQYDSFIDGEFSPYSRIIKVAGGEIVGLGTEDRVAAKATLPSPFMGGNTIAVISPTIVASSVETGGLAGGDHVAIGNVMGDTVFWGVPKPSLISMWANRLLTGNGGVVLYGSLWGLSDYRLWAASVAAGGVTPAYLAVDPLQQIRTPLAGVIPRNAEQIGVGSHALIEKTSSGNFYMTRAQLSGGVATYSNTDMLPNALKAGPYTTPETPENGTLAASPSKTRLLMAYRSGSAWWGARMQVSGNINMAADVFALTPGGTSGFSPAMIFLSEFKCMMVWSSDGVLQGQVVNG